MEFVFAYLALCLLAGFAGRDRRIGFWGCFFCSLIFTPFIILLFLYFMAPGNGLISEVHKPPG
jgi:hypothetical protein